MDALLWFTLPVIVAIGSALLAFYIMQARMEVALAKERGQLVEARAMIAAQQETMTEKLRATEEAVQRRALDSFLAEIRIEERHYVRESKSAHANRKSMVLQERLYFRNMPLSNWIEHEMTVEEDGDLPQLAKARSVFSHANLTDGAGPSRLLAQ